MFRFDGYLNSAVQPLCGIAIERILAVPCAAGLGQVIHSWVQLCLNASCSCMNGYGDACRAGLYPALGICKQTEYDTLRHIPQQVSFKGFADGQIPFPGIDNGVCNRISITLANAPGGHLDDHFSRGRSLIHISIGQCLHKLVPSCGQAQLIHLAMSVCYPLSKASPPAVRCCGHGWAQICQRKALEIHGKSDASYRSAGIVLFGKNKACLIRIDQCNSFYCLILVKADGQRARILICQ